MLACVMRYCQALRDITAPNNLLYSPTYFGDVYAPVTAAPGRTNLRSATRGDLAIPRTRTKLGERNYRISAPTVWNSLPDSLKHFATSRKHFQKELKTYLFRKAYAPTSENYIRVNLLTYSILWRVDKVRPQLANVLLYNTLCGMTNKRI